MFSHKRSYNLFDLKLIIILFFKYVRFHLEKTIQNIYLQLWKKAIGLKMMVKKIMKYLIFFRILKDHTRLYTGRLILYICLLLSIIMFKGSWLKGQELIILVIFECRVQPVNYGLDEIVWEDDPYYGIYLPEEMIILF